jgi:colanic acid/amylovoran biosynthesis glycosyltransferase
LIAPLIYLVRAHHRLFLTHKYPGSKINYELRIIGDGPLLDRLKELSKGLNIKFLGELDHQNVLKEISSGSIFILPCINSKDGDSEGIPVSIMEAMANNIPVISTTHAGIPQLIQNGKEGILSNKKDKRSLSKNIAKEIIKLIHDEELKKDMVNNAKNKVQKNFNIKTQSEKLLDHYKKLLAHKK